MVNIGFDWILYTQNIDYFRRIVRRSRKFSKGVSYIVFFFGGGGMLGIEVGSGPPPSGSAHDENCPLKLIMLHTCFTYLRRCPVIAIIRDTRVSKYLLYLHLGSVL